MAAAELFQFCNVINRLAFIRLIHFGIPVKSRHNVQTILIKATVGHQRLTQLACTDENRIGHIVIAQKLLNVFNKRFPEITDLGTASIGNHGKILTNLNLTHAQGIGQRCCRNMGRGILRHILQICQVSGQPLQNGF